MEPGWKQVRNVEALRKKIQMLLEKYLSKRHKINTYR